MGTPLTALQKQNITLTYDQLIELFRNELQGKVKVGLEKDIKAYWANNRSAQWFGNPDSAFTNAMNSIETLKNKFFQDNAGKTIYEIEQNLKNIAHDPISYFKSAGVSQEAIGNLTNVQNSLGSLNSVVPLASLNTTVEALAKVNITVPVEQKNPPVATVPKPPVTKARREEKKPAKAKIAGNNIPTNTAPPVVPASAPIVNPVVTNNSVTAEDDAVDPNYTPDFGDAPSNPLSDILGNGDVLNQVKGWATGENGLPVTQLFTMLFALISSIFGFAKEKNNEIDLPPSIKGDFTNLMLKESQLALREEAKKEGHDVENKRYELSDEAAKKFDQKQGELIKFSSQFLTAAIAKAKEGKGDNYKLTDDELGKVMTDLGMAVTGEVKKIYTDFTAVDFVEIPLQKGDQTAYVDLSSGMYGYFTAEQIDAMSNMRWEPINTYDGIYSNLHEIDVSALPLRTNGFGSRQ